MSSPKTQTTNEHRVYDDSWESDCLITKKYIYFSAVLVCKFYHHPNNKIWKDITLRYKPKRFSNIQEIQERLSLWNIRKN